MAANAFQWAGLEGMRTSQPLFRIRIVVGLCMLMAAAPSGFSPTNVKPSVSIQNLSNQSPSTNYAPVGTYLYLWYGYNLTSHEWTGGNGTSHWNDGTNIVVDIPEYGICKTVNVNTCYYASDNNNTLAWQLSNIQQAGIKVIVVPWWGTGNTTQSTSPTLDAAVNNATLNLFKYLESTQNLWSFKIAIMVDAFYNSTKYSMSLNDWAHIYEYLDARYYGPYANLIFSWEGNPLVMFFNAPGMNRLAQLPSNSTFTTRMVGNGFGSPPQPVPGWFFWEGDGENYLDYNGTSAPIKNYNYAPQVSSDGMVGIIPRYDDYYQPSRSSLYMRWDYTYSQGLYAAQWNYLIQRPNVAQLVLVYGWNEYQERSQLEPHYDHTVTSGFFSGVNATSNYVQALEKAYVFDYTLSNHGPVTVQSGSSATVQITATLTSGSTWPIALYCVNPWPAGITCNWSPADLLPTEAADLLVTVASGIAPGNSTIEVSGLPIGATTTPTNVTVTIIPPPKLANTIFGLDPTEFYGITGAAVAILAVVIVISYRRKRVHTIRSTL